MAPNWLSSLFRRTAPVTSTAPDEASSSILSVPPGFGTKTTDQIITQMLDGLKSFLPGAVSGLPAPSVSVVSLKERLVGLGNRTGNEARASFGVVELKGRRFDATVRVQLWNTNLNDLETAMINLNLAIEAARQALFAAGFLKLLLINSFPAEFENSENAWRKQADYSILFEYGYRDTDEAKSIISRIPVLTDPLTSNSPFREINVVSDEMVRWDNEQAPALLLRGPSSISGLSHLYFVDSAVPTVGVVFLRTFLGASGAPADYGNLTDFLNAINDPLTPVRHARLVFPAFSDFLTEFSAAGDAIRLGDWNLDGNPDSYTAASLSFSSTIVLSRSTDIFEISCLGASLDQVAVLYMKAGLI